MKYWLFEEGDVVGPFTARQLAERVGFGAGSLVCPEDKANDESSWKPAASYEAFTFADTAAADEGELPSVAAEVFEEEMMATLSGTKSALASPDDLEPAPTHQAVLRVSAKRAAKCGPIEDYFNNIKGEDLGDILGIPDPNENSDMNLQRALETQLTTETNPLHTSDESAPEQDPFDEFTSAEEDPGALFPPVKQRDANKNTSKVLSSAPIMPQKETQPLNRKTEASVLVKPAMQPLSAVSAPKQENITPAVQNKLSNTAVLAPVVHSVPLSKDGDNFLAPAAKQEVLAPANPVKEAVQSVPENTDKPQASAVKKNNLTPVAEKIIPAVPPDIVPLGGNALSRVPAGGERLAVAQPLNKETATQPTAHLPVQKGLPANNVHELVQQEPVRRKLPSTTTEEMRIKPRLVPTPEIEEFVTARIVREKRPYGKALAWAALVFVLSLLCGMIYLKHTEVLSSMRPVPPTSGKPVHKMPAYTAPVQPRNTQTKAAAALPPRSAQPAEPTLPPRTPAASMAMPQHTAQSYAMPGPLPRNGLAQTEPTLVKAEDKALSAVKNFYLPQMGVTIGQYFDNIYKDKKAEGYITSWAVEPLHKNIYVVKYRVSKTRQEPVVYIFQADVVQGKLTGALNNAALDLVGKLN